eukprot:CAMPEP_0172464874 /NCGR_PEP_ID=MMETSP1065-20121228/51818_1 /TAXON_ID=265537 /ORGANISM="Amphiprora paludosa, Strain CCMP125" /LENGTH=338 /DNA_ID=CAMNT_0013221233 /DNA_START=42 /DNA_END=1058 /DNA_ORIENTATION=+
MQRLLLLCASAVVALSPCSAFLVSDMGGVRRWQKNRLHQPSSSSRSGWGTTTTTIWAAASEKNSSKNNTEDTQFAADSGDLVDASASSTTLFEDLETELSQLKRELQVQKGTYEQQLHVLEEESKVQSEQAESALQQIVKEYEDYKQEMASKLEQAPSSSAILQMERDLAGMRERTATQEAQLDMAKSQLLTNREARKQLQAEMVALKHTYLTKLAEIEDALETEQDGRVRDQQQAAQELEESTRSLKQQLATTIAESKLYAAQLAKDFEQKLQLRDEEKAELETTLRQVEASVGERELRIAVLEEERNSWRKVTMNWLRLVRQKLNPFQRKKKEDEE